MPNSIDFYKGIFLHVIPVCIIVPWSDTHLELLRMLEAQISGSKKVSVHCP